MKWIEENLIHISRYIGFWLAIVLICGCRANVHPVTTLTSKPNIILIVVDDLGWSDTGFMGNPHYQTPAIDRMASTSVVFKNAYAPAANCAPSRACMLTGKNTPRHGIYTVGSSARGKSVDRKLIPIENTVVLEDDMVTLAEMLKNHGYVSASIGKWHLGESPLSQGFDLNIRWS